MIKLKSLISHLLLERLTYGQLLKMSDPERKDRASRIPSKSLVVKSVNDREAWKFSYKTPNDEITKSPEFPNGQRHQGFIYFYKDSLQPGENAMNIECSVDCSCRDYRYRFSNANKAEDAGENGPNSLNKGLNYPSSINRGPGLCKHLIALENFLRTTVETPEEPGTVPVGQPVVVPNTPGPGEEPPEEPEETPEDPTKAPEEPEDESPLEPSIQSVGDKTEAPQEPEDVPEDPNVQEPDSITPEDEVEPNKKLKEMKLTESNFVNKLNKFCETHRIFVV